MTRKKFVGGLLDAISTYASVADELPLESAKKFENLKAGVFFGVDEDGSNEVEHYILVELSDGTKWRIIPERVLQLEEHEVLLWNEFKRSEEAGEANLADEEIEEEDDDEGLLPDPDIGTDE